MGAFTPIDEIWYPDEDDTAEQNVNLATMASSIEEGIGQRLRAQETFLGLFATRASGQTLTKQALTTVQFGLDSPSTFNTGFTFSNGIITIETPGLYYVGVNVVIQIPDGYGEICIVKSGNEYGKVLQFKGSASNNVGLSTSSVVNCVAGDTIWTRTYIDSSTNANFNTNSQTFNTLSVSLLKALN
jgi:hypothetical protein